MTKYMYKLVNSNWYSMKICLSEGKANICNKYESIPVGYSISI